MEIDGDETKTKEDLKKKKKSSENEVIYIILVFLPTRTFLSLHLIMIPKKGTNIITAPIL